LLVAHEATMPPPAHAFVPRNSTLALSWSVPAPT